MGVAASPREFRPSEQLTNHRTNPLCFTWPMTVRGRVCAVMAACARATQLSIRCQLFVSCIAFMLGFWKTSGTCSLPFVSVNIYVSGLQNTNINFTERLLFFYECNILAYEQDSFFTIIVWSRGEKKKLSHCWTLFTYDGANLGLREDGFSPHGRSGKSLCYVLTLLLALHGVQPVIYHFQNCLQ